MSERSILALGLVVLYLLRLGEILYSNAKKEKGTIRAPWTTGALVVSGSIVYLGSAAEAALWTFPLIWPLTIAGGILAVFRAAVKIWSVRTLGRAWSAFIEIRRGQELVTEGPYAYVRHPVYLSAFVEVICIPMIGGAPVSAAFAILVHWSLIGIRTREEEAALRGRFGEAYDAYCLRVPAFFPRLWPSPTRSDPSKR